MPDVSKLQSSVQRLIYPAGVNPLPGRVCILHVLGVALDYCVWTMAFAFLPQMIKTFNVEEVDIGRKAGWVASSLFLARIFSSVAWGMLVDRIGSKFVCVASSLFMAITTVLFGFSCNLEWAIVTRFLQGASSGMLVSSKSMLYQLSDNTNQQYAAGFISLAFSIGNIVGPAIGGCFVFPADVFPSTFPKGSLFDRFPFLLPNLMVAAMLVVSFLTMLAWLPDLRVPKEADGKARSSVGAEADERLLKSEPGYSPPEHGSGKLNRPNKIKQMLASKDVMLCCFLFLLFSLATTGSLEILPVWAATDRSFSGLGYSTSDIGLMFALVACITVFSQPLLTMRIITYLKPKKSLVSIGLSGMLVYPLYPTTTLIENRSVLLASLVFLVVWMRSASLCIFGPLNIFINNAVAPHLVGTANGAGMMFSTIGQAIAPSFIGALYSWSLTNTPPWTGRTESGFPFNHYFAFYALSLINLATVFFGAHCPEYLEKKRDWQAANVGTGGLVASNRKS